MTARLIAAFGLVLWTGAAASAQRVAVAPFSGPQSSRVQEEVIAGLSEGGMTVVSWDEVAAQAGRDRLLESDYATVASALSIDAFIRGRVSRARRRWNVRLSLRDGVSPDRIGSATISGRSVSALRRACRSTAYERVAPIVQNASAPPPAADDMPSTEDIENEVPWYERGNTDGEEETDEEEEEEDRYGAPPNPNANRWDALRIALTGGTLRRDMQNAVLVNGRFAADSQDLYGDNPNYTEGGIGHGELGLVAEVFPGAFLEEPVVPWLGLVTSFRLGLGASYGTITPGGAAIDIGTSQREFTIGVRADIDVLGLLEGGGAGGRGWFVTVDAGYGLMQFLFDVDGLRQADRQFVVPPVGHSYLNLGLGTRYFFSEEVALGIRAAYRQGLGVGSDALNIWGTETQPASGFLVGGDFEARLDSVAPGVFIRFSVEWFRFSTTFEGPRACPFEPATSCTADAAWLPDPVILDTTDTYLRLALSVGYAL
ncbi:MAG: hypothetical protein AAF411_06415 [Myxococcota bacterium]